VVAGGGGVRAGGRGVGRPRCGSRLREDRRSRWRRPDGGYVLDLRKVRPDGAIDAAYLNPRPINVGKAQASRDGATVRVFVELRAPNYPGSTYTLTYDPKRDELYGVYYQAVEGRSFDVVFVRMK
jgi:hypothetical protein